MIVIRCAAKKNGVAQNIYDNPEFFAGYSGLPRQVRGLDGAPEWPVVSKLFPSLANKHVLDLGCGFGWASRWMRAHGAESVVGIDLSARMIARARAGTADTAIDYRICDLAALDLPSAAFDLAFSSLAFHYVEDWTDLVSRIAAALKPGGDLIFTIEHPVYMAPLLPQWTVDGDGRRSWPVNGYFVEGERRMNWFTDGVIKYHRTIATTLDGLFEAGFALNRLVEFVPAAAQIGADPTLSEEIDRPMLLIVSASLRGR